ncbi:MAG: hypothetical protein ABI323_05560 [Solirubrobacteraceae bacterium]
MALGTSAATAAFFPALLEAELEAAVLEAAVLEPAEWLPVDEEELPLPHPAIATTPSNETASENQLFGVAMACLPI